MLDSAVCVVWDTSQRYTDGLKINAKITKNYQCFFRHLMLGVFYQNLKFPGYILFDLRNYCSIGINTLTSDRFHTYMLVYEQY